MNDADRAAANLVVANLVGALAIGCGDLQLAAVRKVGLDTAEMAGLLAVHARPGGGIGEVARTTSLTHSGAVRVIDRLSTAGLVERGAAADRRSVALRCTDAGRRTAEAALLERRWALEDLLSALDDDERAALGRLAEKLVARLPGDRADAWRICRLCEHESCRDPDCPVSASVP